MSAQLPYLPPFDPTKQNVQPTAAATAEQVRAAQAGQAVQPVPASRAGLVYHDALGNIVSAAADAAKWYVAPQAAAVGAIANNVVPFVQSAVTGQPVGAPTAGLPKLLTPPAPAVPATQAPVIAPAPPTLPAGGLQTTSTTDANGQKNVSITGDGTPVTPTTNLPQIVFRQSPVHLGVQEQAAYAEQQRQAVLNAADVAAASGHPDNASYRYAAALNALPHLSGSNNFATVEGSLASEATNAAERERANIRTVAEQRYQTDENNKQLRRTAMFQKIGEDVNPAGPAFPPLGRYGFIERDQNTGKVTVYDAHGAVQTAAPPPVSRGDFITRNKKANPGMSEADLGREYDKKYGAKS